VRVEEEVAEAVDQPQVALAMREGRGALLRRVEELALRRDVLAQAGKALEHVLVTTQVGGEHVRAVSDPAPAEELPPRGRPFDPEQFAAIAAEHGIELLGPPGALPEA
jgi:hypothetical protein